MITIPAGTFPMTRSLVLSASGVTIKGAGMDKSILSFKGQVAAYGISKYETGDEVTSGSTCSVVQELTSPAMPITYTWNFGHDVDVITTTANIVHSFPLTSTTRSYTVTLAATNACGTQAAAPKLITVQLVQVYLPLILK